MVHILQAALYLVGLAIQFVVVILCRTVPEGQTKDDQTDSKCGPYHQFPVVFDFHSFQKRSPLIIFSPME